MQTKIYVPDITCESCVKLIDKKFKGVHGINHAKFTEEDVTIEHDEQVKPDQLVSAVKILGFRASLDPFERKTFKERRREFRENREKYGVERKAMQYSILAIGILFVLEALAYVGIFRNIPDFLPKYGWWIFYLTISVVAIGIAMWHILSYKAKITCMVGMMIGMTIGMQAGMMIGAIMGATNGFFIGSMSGMLIGVVVGALMGKCCGVMGIMEGMMAGLMGGTMGPMISVMMFNDHLLIFMPFYMAINLLIIVGLSYMFVQEVADGKEIKRNPQNFPGFIAALIIATTILIALMTYGPRSVLFGG
ncbi:MAG: cation transporter [Nanoarchaeota archaeon]